MERRSMGVRQVHVRRKVIALARILVLRGRTIPVKDARSMCPLYFNEATMFPAKFRTTQTFVFLALLLCLLAPSLFAQGPVILSADGQTDTYTLLDNTLGGTAEETPDCSHTAFGPHITLAPFLGTWVEAHEHITFGSSAFGGVGHYSLTIKRISDGVVLLTHNNDNIDLWRTSTTFCRPKWGIYRSLNSPSYLRDEDVRFNDYCLAKGTDTCPTS